MCHITILYISTISLHKFLHILQKSLEKYLKRNLIYIVIILYMSKNIKRNTKALQTTYDNYKNRLTQGTRTKIQNLIIFYEDRKIAQFTTADNLIRQFITAKIDKQKTKANTAYDKIHDKHHDKEPLGQRMREAKKENKKRNSNNIYTVDALFYRLKDEKMTRNSRQRLKTAKADHMLFIGKTRKP